MPILVGIDGTGGGAIPGAAQGQTASYQQNPLLRAEVLKWRDKV